MSNGVIAFFVGAGVAAWVYSKMMRRTGGITQNALIVAGVAGFFSFIITLIAASALL